MNVNLDQVSLIPMICIRILVSILIVHAIASRGERHHGWRRHEQIVDQIKVPIDGLKMDDVVKMTSVCISNHLNYRERHIILGSDLRLTLPKYNTTYLIFDCESHESS